MAVKGEIIVDTGPLVAFLVGNDRHHSWAAERFRELRAPFLTCDIAGRPVRNLPAEIVMSAEIRKRVDELWPSLGIRLSGRK